MLLIPSLKYKTKHQQIQQLSDAKVYYLPLNAYRTVMNPVIEVGATVCMYQKVAVSEGVFSSCMHAPVSGTFLGIKEIDGKAHMIIENDFKNLSVEQLPLDVLIASREEILERIRDFGVEGSGGALFPTHRKLDTVYELTTFIVNGVECEPYLSADYVLMSEQLDALFRGIEIVRKITGVQEVVFGIEKQNKKLRPFIEQKGAEYGLKVRVKLVKNTYPQGGELQLIESVTGKKLPKGSIPAHHGLIVQNVGTLWAIYNAVCEGKPYTERIITLSGNKHLQTGNYLVKIGTPVDHVLTETGNQWDATKQTVILGGPMMGKAVHTSEHPIGKGSGGLLLLNNQQSQPENCIGCGYCVDVCPQQLMPLEFVRYNAQEDVEKMAEYNLQDCIECGACAYSCPSDVPLMQSIFQGKQQLEKNR